MIGYNGWQIFDILKASRAARERNYEGCAVAAMCGKVRETQSASAARDKGVSVIRLGTACITANLGGSSVGIRWGTRIREKATHTYGVIPRLTVEDGLDGQVNGRL